MLKISCKERTSPRVRRENNFQVYMAHGHHLSRAMGSMAVALNGVLSASLDMPCPCGWFHACLWRNRFS